MLSLTMTQIIVSQKETTAIATTKISYEKIVNGVDVEKFNAHQS
jgi:hypothetical protein